MGLIAGFAILIVSVVLAPFAFKRQRGKRGLNQQQNYEPPRRGTGIAEHRRA